MKKTALALTLACSAALMMTQTPAAFADNTDTVTVVRSGDGDTLRAIFYEHYTIRDGQLVGYGDQLKYWPVPAWGREWLGKLL